MFWVRRFILFHGKRHPADMSAAEVEAFLTHLAVNRQVSASTQNQALAALLFLYKKVLQVELPWLDGVVRAKQSRHLPVVLTPGEVKDVLSQLQGEYWLIASLLYGAGLRLLEALTLRVKDVQFDYRQLMVRSGKGGKDRSAILADALVAPLQRHLVAVKAAGARSRPRATPSGTASPRTCSSAVTTSARRAGAARAQGCQDHTDLHPRDAQGRERCAEPAGSMSRIPMANPRLDER